MLLPPRPFRMSAPWTAALLIASLGACVAGAPGAGPAHAACPAQAGFATQAASFLDLLNDARRAEGLSPLVADPALAAAARAHSCDMAGTGKLSHQGSDGADLRQRLSRVGLPRLSLWAENVAYGQESVAEVFESWMASPAHRANILRPGLTRMGLGLVQGGAPYWTLVLAGPPL